MIDNDMVRLAVGILLVVGAINWGMAELLDTNLLVEFGVSRGTQAYNIVIGTIAAAGAYRGYALIEEEV